MLGSITKQHPDKSPVAHIFLWYALYSDEVEFIFESR